MKKTRLLIHLAGCFVVGGALCLVAQEPESPPELKTLAEKASYSYGYQMGSNFKRMGAEPNLEVFMRGLKDALFEQSCQLEEQELRTSMMDYRRELKQGVAARNRQEGMVFLEENQKKPGIETLPSGLQYKILVTGDGPKPTSTDRVKVHYRGSRVDGVEFDSSHKRGVPAVFRVNGVIKGWTEALQLMNVGSKWQLFIPPDIAYGENARGQLIRPNETLIFEVELISIEP